MPPLKGEVVRVSEPEGLFLRFNTSQPLRGSLLAGGPFLPFRRKLVSRQKENETRDALGRRTTKKSGWPPRQGPAAVSGTFAKGLAFASPERGGAERSEAEGFGQTTGLTQADLSGGLRRPVGRLCRSKAMDCLVEALAGNVKVRQARLMKHSLPLPPYGAGPLRGPTISCPSPASAPQSRHRTGR